VLANGALYFGLKQKVGKITFKNLDLKKHILPTIKLFLPQVASLIFLQCDKIMIKFLSEDITHVGFYDQAERIIKMPLALITALSVVMLPRISNEFKNKNIDNVKTYITKAFNFSLMMAIPLMFGLAAVSKTMIPWFLGTGYEDVANIMVVLAPIVLFISLSSVSGNQYLTAVDKTKVLTISCVAGAVVNVILNAIFIPMFNSVGAAIGTIGAELTVIAIQLINIKDVIKIRDLIKLSLKYIIAGLAMFVLCMFVGNKLGTSIISTLVQICSGGAIYFIILLILRDAFFKECINKALDIAKQKILKKS
jgi:O-antigen/teichoic acid export membrane protein